MRARMPTTRQGSRTVPQPSSSTPSSSSSTDRRSSTPYTLRSTRHTNTIAPSPWYVDHDEDWEESDDSDAESVQSQKNQRLDRDESPSQPEEEVDEASSTAVALSVRSCTVVLERVPLEEDMERRDPDDNEDMSRRAGRQPLSRIPTLSALTKKRPTAVHNPESLLSKRDGVSHTPDSGEVPKSMVPSASRETALLLPSVRVPRVSGAEHAASELPMSLPVGVAAYSLVEEPEQQNVVVVTARPALRAEPAHRTSEVKTNVSPEDHTIPHLSSEVSVGEMQESEVDASVIGGECTTPVDGKGEAGQVTSIADEEPPWESELIKPILDIEEDDDSSSDIQSVDDTAAVESGVLTVSESDEAHHDESYSEPENVPTLSSAPAERIPDTDDPAAATVIPTPAKTKVKLPAKKSTCSSFATFCLLPTTLLLLGGLGLHVWQYGLPRSVEQLLAQLELHWLEGLGVVQEPCSTDCRVRLLESMPIGLYPSSPPPALPSVTSGWLSLLEQANRSVDIAAFYFALRSSDLPEATDSQVNNNKGREVFEQLMHLEYRGVNLQIAVNSPQTSPQDTQQLAGTGADVREVDLGSLTGGIVHTKLWVVDQKHMYLGSANMDWRSLSQVKEVGVSVEDCSCLAQDASRIFGVYWNIGAERNASLPPYWPARFSALSSALHPLHLKLNGVPARVYLSSAPPQISARGRTDDLASILSVISDARKSVYISVMDYLPLSQYTEPLRFWPAIDSALRSAACTRGVEVRLMVSCWQHSSESMFIFLQSLLVLHRPPLRCNINIRVFVVPSTAEQSKIPFARVNHAKYMVTDRVLYIGTSNWSEDYFTHTAGVGLVVNQTGSEVAPGQVTLRSQAEELFLRDWTSDYATPLPDNGPYVCAHHHH